MITKEQVEAKAIGTTELHDLRPEQRQRLEREDIEDLFPVQKACFKLFVEGREVIVK